MPFITSHPDGDLALPLYRDGGEPYIACPHCAEVNSKIEDAVQPEPGHFRDVEWQCDGCGKKFAVTALVSIRYHTQGVPHEE